MTFGISLALIMLVYDMAGARNLSSCLPSKTIATFMFFDAFFIAFVAFLSKSFPSLILVASSFASSDFLSMP